MVGTSAYHLSLVRIFDCWLAEGTGMQTPNSEISPDQIHSASHKPLHSSRETGNAGIGAYVDGLSPRRVSREEDEDDHPQSLYP